LKEAGAKASGAPRLTFPSGVTISFDDPGGPRLRLNVGPMSRLACHWMEEDGFLYAWALQPPDGARDAGQPWLRDDLPPNPLSD
jgi:hypothetical protein